MINLVIQLDHVCSQLKPKQLGKIYEGFSWSYHLRWENHPKFGLHLLVAAHRETEKKEAFALGLLALTLAPDVYNQSKGL